MFNTTIHASAENIVITMENDAEFYITHLKHLTPSTDWKELAKLAICDYLRLAAIPLGSRTWLIRHFIPIELVEEVAAQFKGRYEEEIEG